MYGVDSFKVLFDKVASHFAENGLSSQKCEILYLCMREQGISSKDKSTINVYLVILFMHGRSLNIRNLSKID